MHSIKDIVKQLIGKSLDAYNTKYTKVLNTRIDNIVAQAGNDNTEIVDARIDSAGVTHTTLNNRILAETKMNDEQLVEYTGNNISAEDTTQGYLKDVEILGNTIQNEEDLADIKSVGVLQEDGTYKMSILSCGKNILDANNFILGDLNWNTGEYKSNNSRTVTNGFIKIKPSSTYIFSSNRSSDIFTICEYDKNKKFIQSIAKNVANNKVLTISTNAIYIKVSVTNANTLDNLQLEEGTVATPYEPYQENKCDILLPCQLEKVGDVSDRLYYDDVEKVWCIEKNIETIVLNGSETWLRFASWDTTNTMAFYLDYNAYKVYNKDIAKKGYTECKSNLFNYSTREDFVDLIDKEKIVMYGRHAEPFTCSPQISILKSKLPTQDVTGFKTWLSQNPTLVKYQLAIPQKIVLPLSTQIALNSFFGTTHVYMESGEVEGTIKCKIPKSLGATVQSLNNKTDILSDRIEAIEGLKDSQNMKYETDKGYLVCKETKNGVIDDLKIEGKTLVNLYQPKHFYPHSGGWNTIILKVDLLKTNTKYYYKIFNLPSDFKHVITDENNVYLGDYTTSSFNNFTTINTITPTITLHINNQEMEELTLEQLQGLQILILEGDHTQNPPSYFEGLMSVGQDVDEIEVLSRKEDGNLLMPLHTGVTTNSYDKNNITFSSDYSMSYVANGWGQGLSVDVIGVVKGETYVILCDTSTNMCIKGANALKTTSDIQMYSNKAEIVATTTGIGTITFKNATETGNISCTNLRVIKKGSKEEFSSLKQDKKQILFYNENGELEPIQELREWDSIEKHSDNKWYYHKRSGKVVLNGSESDTIEMYTDGAHYLQFNFKFDKHNLNDYKALSDRFVNVRFTNQYDSECFSMHSQKLIVFKILKSKLSTQDVAGFKQWLQANNVTVVYQLEEEEVYEIAPLHLDSYANETLILCNSGAISPKMEFSITSHINELVKAYGERINLLEEKVYKYMVTQNRMQLASTYSADSVTFKVDYFSLCGDEENYDEDLYNLILNNILVGKDNYDYDKMFTMILDYASWNQISWEQFDILVGLMDMQHNPPVEEEITEDESIEETPVE